jgi:hypothetical protein
MSHVGLSSEGSPCHCAILRQEFNCCSAPMLQCSQLHEKIVARSARRSPRPRWLLSPAPPTAAVPELAAERPPEGRSSTSAADASFRHRAASRPSGTTSFRPPIPAAPVPGSVSQAMRGVTVLFRTIFPTRMPHSAAFPDSEDWYDPEDFVRRNTDHGRHGGALHTPNRTAKVRRCGEGDALSELGPSGEGLLLALHSLRSGRPDDARGCRDSRRRHDPNAAPRVTPGA